MENRLVVKMRCLCGQTEQEVSPGSKSLPIDIELCHCNMCRLTSGMLCTAYLDLVSKPQLQHLQAYQVSKEDVRYFCGTCGTHVLAYSVSRDQYRVASGAIEPACNFTRVIGHENVEETIDGGLQNFLTGHPLGAQQVGEEKGKGKADQHLESQSEDKRGRRLNGKCYCGGVEYFITPPTHRSEQLSSPWPDLLVPYHNSSPENKGDVKWWIRSGGTKYLAGLCTCRSCRLGAGFPIQSWAFVPKINIERPDGRPLDFRIGTLKQFESSPSVYREFCSECGATVFWHCDERPDLIDVSVGLLHAPGGVLALDWLDWHTGRVSFAEEAQDQELVDDLELGLRSWKVHHS